MGSGSIPGRSRGMDRDSTICRHVSESWVAVSKSYRDRVAEHRLSVTYSKRRVMPRAETNPIRLLLVDDHEVLRIGLRTSFTEAGGFHVVGEAGTMASAVVDASRLKPRVVLMDVRLPDGSGIDACRTIRTANPDTRVLFLTSFADDDWCSPPFWLEPTDFS